MEPDGGAGQPVLTLLPTEEPPPKRRKGGGKFDPTEDERALLRMVLDEQTRLHRAYGWRAGGGGLRTFKVSGGTCRVALACIRGRLAAADLIAGLRAICYREAHAEGIRATGKYATLSGMLGGGAKLEPGKSDKLERALADFEDAGRPEPEVHALAVQHATPSYSAIAAGIDALCKTTK